MKKSIALVALAFGVTNAFAQDLTSKKGEPFLPEAGDWGIAIDATPFLNYAGNMFGKTANNVAPTWNFLTTAQTITGRYFKDEKTVYRGSLRIGMNSNKQRNMVADRTPVTAGSQTVFPNAFPMKENTWKSSSSTIGLAAGIEMRKGKTRLQGYYGGEVGVYVNMSKSKFEYGNALAASTTPSAVVGVDNTDDAFTGAGNVNVTPPIQGINGSARATEIKNGTVFSFGLRGFVGAEYFILPKISVGGEFGWGVGLSSTGKSKTTWESIGGPATAPTVGNTEIEGSKQNGLSLDTDGKNSVWGPTGTLRLNLYF
ncbi:MAG: hypothetical protein Q8T03_08310 [Bacteroidota bacterium]|nr:hypothetical protein [Bacteroidota bacterium]